MNLLTCYIKSFQFFVCFVAECSVHSLSHSFFFSFGCFHPLLCVVAILSAFLRQVHVLCSLCVCMQLVPKITYSLQHAAALKYEVCVCMCLLKSVVPECVCVVSEKEGIEIFIHLLLCEIRLFAYEHEHTYAHIAHRHLDKTYAHFPIN